MNRRQFLQNSLCASTLFSNLMNVKTLANENVLHNKHNPSANITLFLCGDVMTGRGIDQALPHPSDPKLYEPYVRDARRYIDLAEQANGPITRPLEYTYIWGDALSELQIRTPAARIINLETSVTTNDQHWPMKGIHYRMHPKNISCILAAEIDCCVLANNHVLDWGYDGLSETLDTLHNADLVTAGAGRNLKEATAPAIIKLSDKVRIIVYSFCLESSGVPGKWAAGSKKAGVNYFADLSDETVDHISNHINNIRHVGDIVVVSIHWGGNWGYQVPKEQIQFAHNLIDNAEVNIIHGHSSHHPKGVEIYKNKPIIYGCGDFFNDYEGIGGYEEYRGDLTLMYFVTIDPNTGELVEFEMVPMQIKRFRLNRATIPDIKWLHSTLNREYTKFNHGVELSKENILSLLW